MIYLSNGYHDYADTDFTPDIKMIAFSLANQNRYNGHVGGYSVAQHSVLCSIAVSPEHALAALLHDAAEAYMGDLVSPLKNVCDEFRAIEFMHEKRIGEFYGVDLHHEAVRTADLRMLLTEATHFKMDLEHFPPVEPYFGIMINEYSARDAEQKFLQRFADLTA